MRSKFTFSVANEDGSKIEMNFSTKFWYETFPKLLALLRAAGWSIDEKTALYAPQILYLATEDINYIIGDEDLQNA